MNDLFARFFEARPHRLTLAGRALYRLAAAQIVLGVVADVIVTSMRHARHDGAYRWIADVFPASPTWWIPETVPGVLAVVVLGAAGLVLAYEGRRLDRRRPRPLVQPSGALLQR